jgi:pimeloyl-ACP methyl ester carboxylesterase
VDGAWWWSRVADLLPFESVAAELPSCMDPGGPSLAEDVVAVRELITGPTILVAHSYGGIVATNAATPDLVRQLVYIDSFLPDVGESLGGGEPPPYLDFRDDGTFGVRTETVVDLFLQDCDPAAVDGAVARLTRQTSAAVSSVTTRAAWREIPSSYLVCAEDRATLPEVQRAQARRAGRVVELPTGHHPMLSRPELVAAAITAG